MVCGKLSAIRILITKLQQPYEEDRERVIANFLYTKEIQDMELNKESLYQMWNMRNRKIRESCDLRAAVSIYENGWGGRD